MASGKAKQSQAFDAISEFESKGEQFIDWVAANARIVLGVAAGCLVVAAIYGFAHGAGEKREAAASEAVAEVRSEYLTAMGAAPGALTVPELANPAAAAGIRDEFRKRFAAVAAEHPDTTGGVMASLAEGDLARDAGDTAAAIEIWRAAMAKLPAGSGLVGLLQHRIAQALEAGGDWAGAAEAYLRAADVPAYTFRYWAMAEAARCFLAADQPERALQLYQRIQDEAPDYELTDSLRTRLRELQARGAG